MSATLPLMLAPKFTDLNNVPLAGGKLYFYQAGTLVPQAAYTDSTGLVALSNPLILDANGQGVFWLKVGLTYKINLTSSADVQQPNFPIDNIIADPSSGIYTQLASTTAGQGDALIGVQQPVTGAAPRNQHLKNLDLISLTDFAGADPTGATNSDAALQAAINYGAFRVPEGTFVIGTPMVVNNHVAMIGVGMNRSIIKQASHANCNLFNVNGDYTLEAYNMQFDGNGALQTQAVGTTDGFAVPIGSLVLDHCYLHHFKCNVIRTGNVESTFGFAFDINKYAHDLSVTNCYFDQGLTALGYGDHIRLFKVTRGFIANNYMTGGLSPLRVSYYCSFLAIANNYVTATGDVGVTLSLATDCTVTGNVCTFNKHHGMEIDSVKRVAIAGNTCSSNTNRGITVSTFPPPIGTLYTYNGYFDGTMLVNTATGTINSGSASLSFSACSTTLSAGMTVAVGASTALGYIVSVTNGGVAPCVATMSQTAGSTYTNAAMQVAACPPCTDLVVSGNNCSNNGYSGISVGGADGVTITGNRMSNNNTANAGEGGLYITGETDNLDNAQIMGNLFYNIGLQTVSIVRGNFQGKYTTRISGNQHIGGTLQCQFPAVGMYNINPDKFFANTANVSGTVPFAPDSNSRTGFVRQIAGGNTGSFIIQNAHPAGNMMLYARIRTPDAAASPGWYVNLQNSGAFVFTIINTAVQVLSTNPVWTEICAWIPSTVMTGSCATNQLTITSSPITLAAGMGIVGTGIAAGTTVSSVTNGGVAPCVATLSTTPGTLTTTKFMVVYNQVYFGVVAAAGATHINVEEVSLFVASE